MRLVEAARSFDGVRFKHRGRDRLGLDCAGLVWASYAACGLILPDYTLYGREPHRDGLVRYVEAALGAPVYDGPVAGDVVVMRFVKEPHHMGVVGSKWYGDRQALTLIHANGDAPGRGRVHETRLTADMIAKITHVFRRPV